MDIFIPIFQDIFLGRSRAFIDLFNSLGNRQLDCGAYSCDPNSFFLCAYGLKVLLDDDSWSAEFKPIISHFRKENEVIWNFLLENKMVPDDYTKKFIDFAKPLAYESIDASYEDVFFAPLETLIKNGATKLDLDLYRASASLEFEEAKRLLQLGANPDKGILFKESDDDEFLEIWSSLEIASTQWYNAYDANESGGDFRRIWKEESEDGFKGALSNSVFYQIIISAAYKLMYEMLEKHDRI